MAALGAGRRGVALGSALGARVDRGRARSHRRHRPPGHARGRTARASRYGFAAATRRSDGFPSFPTPNRRTESLGAIRLAAAAIAVELSREAGGGKSRRKSFWDRLLARAYDDPLEAKDDAASRGITLAAGYVAVAIEAEGLDESSASAKLGELRKICMETLRAGGGDVVALERGGGFVFLCPAPLEVDAQNARTAATLIPRALTKSHFGVKIVGGVGRPATALEAHKTVDDAREAMFVTRRLFGAGTKRNALQRPRHLPSAAARRRDGRRTP